MPMGLQEDLERYGWLRWLGREFVRANPLYVLSAAFIAYGVLELHARIDPQIGQAPGIVLALGVLHIYEWALLGAAAVVLRSRRGMLAGRDCHGLALVAALFLAGSFLALDDLISLWPHRGVALTSGALALAWVKLELYGRLPGLRLLPLVRYTALLLLTAHALASLLGAATVEWQWEAATAQQLAWLAGWLSCVALLALLAHARPPTQELLEFDPDRGERPDLLAMPIAGAWLVGVCAAGGILRLLAADWIFDRPFDAARLLPALTILAGVILLRRWQLERPWTRFALGCAAFPALAVHWAWHARSPWAESYTIYPGLETTVQFTFAAALVYLLLAWITGKRAYLLGLSGPLGAPVWALLERLRETLPHYRALLSSLLGFATLIAAIFVSLYRDRLLRGLEPPPPPPAPPAPEGRPLGPAADAPAPAPQSLAESGGFEADVSISMRKLEHE